MDEIDCTFYTYFGENMAHKTQSSLEKNLVLEKATLERLKKDEKKSPSRKAEEMRDVLEFLRIKEIVDCSEHPNHEKKIQKLKKLIESGQYTIDLDELSEKITKELI